MRRDVAHAVQQQYSTDGVGQNGKARSNAFSRVIRSGRGAAFTSGPVPQRIEESATNRLVVSWNLTRPTTLNRPACSANCLRGFTSDARPKAGLIPAAIFSLSLEESKAQNDVSQLPDRDGKGGIPRKEKSAAVQMSAVREAIL